MQKLWCWRCRIEMPMLDEAEFAEVAKLHSEAVRGVKQFRESTGSDLRHPTISDLFRPVREKYEQLTGMKEIDENAIMHQALRSTDHRAGDVASRCGHRWQSSAPIVGCRYR